VIEAFGPFLPDLDPAERLARIRALRAIALTFAWRYPDLIDSLHDAESEPTALQATHLMFERLPAIPKRRILATYANLFKRMTR
jgi:hypothetical protein